MSQSRGELKKIMDMVELYDKRQKLVRMLDDLNRREACFIDWVTMLEGVAFRKGDKVILAHGTPNEETATVRYSKRNTIGQVWVYLTRENGKKTRRLARNLTMKMN